jgi:ATP-dependent exoDNAse (exonuclease V) beta subunit
VLGVPGPAPEEPAGGEPSRGLAGTARGLIAHALLEQLDFRRPLVPTAEAIARVGALAGVPVPSEAESADLTALVRGFAGSELCARLGRATQIQREQRFTFPLADGTLVTGALDVLAREREGMLVLDYKSDRLAGASPAAIVARGYAIQQLIYALAVLRTGAGRVEVAHVFLERPDEPVVAGYAASDRPVLEARVDALTLGARERRFEVTPEPHRAVCAGCPAEGGLCSWPVVLTRRERPDQLF